MFSFNVLGGLFCAGGIIGKMLTISGVLSINTSLTTGFIILGAVSFMMGVFASVVFKRQAFAEKDMRHYLDNTNFLSSQKESQNN